MQKIMFNDKFGLTKAVLYGTGISISEKGKIKDGVAYRITLIGDLEQSDMKAPDKIYIPENLPNSDKIRLSSVDKKGRGIPYIRKEAFLEWAKEMLKSCDGSVAMRRAYEKLTEHIESL